MKTTMTDRQIILSDTFTGALKPWAAQILGLEDARGLDRRFLGVSFGPIDAATGTRTAQVKLPRVEGAIYELGNWKRSPDNEEIRYYLTVRQNKPVLITHEEVHNSFTVANGAEEDIDLPF